MSDLYRDIALVSVFCHDRSASATASIRFTVSIASTHHSIRFDLLPPMRHRVDSVKVRRLADGVTTTSASTNLTDHPTITCQEVGVIGRVLPVRPSHGWCLDRGSLGDESSIITRFGVIKQRSADETTSVCGFLLSHAILNQTVCISACLLSTPTCCLVHIRF